MRILIDNTKACGLPRRFEIFVIRYRTQRIRAEKRVRKYHFSL